MDARVPFVEHDGMRTARECAEHPWRELGRLLWQQPLWAVPFAIFFATLFGPWPGSLWLTYKMSLTFAFCIRLSLWVFECFIKPRLLADSSEERLPLVQEIVWYAGTAILGSYVAAFLIHRFILPGFLGSPRAVAASGMFTLLFTGLFCGIAYAMVFYRQSVERARTVERIRAELAEAELRALRAQIHPHFLFNALNTIAALIPEDAAAAEDTLTRLAEVFRFTLKGSDRSHTPLGDELDFLRAYLGIEHMRLGDRLRVVEHIEPGLEHVLIPSLLLQPVIENAIRHGIAPRPEGGTLTLSVRRDGDRVAIEVHDDGPGMPETASPSGNGFGLASVRERVRLAGPGHALDVDSERGRGTRVRLTFPFLPPGGLSR